MSLSYTDLTTKIQQELQNSETTFVANIDMFIRQAEQNIYRKVNIPDLRKNSSGTLTASDRFLAKPTDFLSTSSLAVIDGSSEYHFLLPKQQDFIRECYPSITATGLPKYYANFDAEYFILGPTPDSGYSVQLHYFYDPPSIVTTGTSWLGDNAEDALLWGSVVEGYRYLKGATASNEQMDDYLEAFDDALADLSKLCEFRLKRDSYRNNEPRVEA